MPSQTKGCKPSAQLLKDEGRLGLSALKDNSNWYDQNKVTQRKGGYVFYLNEVVVLNDGLESLDTPHGLGNASTYECLIFGADPVADLVAYLTSQGVTVKPTDKIEVARWIENGNCHESKSEKCLIRPGTMEFQVNTSAFSLVKMCRKVDSQLVLIRGCKTDGEVFEYYDSDNATTFDQTFLDENYAADCEEIVIEKENLDTREFLVNLLEGDAAQDLTAPEVYDAVEIFNCSPCPILATIQLTQPDASVTPKKITLLPGERRVLDYGCDAISDMSIGEVALGNTGVVATNDLETSAATQNLKVRVTYFDS